MPGVIESVRGEFLRYKDLAEKAIAQIGDQELSGNAADGDNSIATICWHILGKSELADLRIPSPVRNGLHSAFRAASRMNSIVGSGRNEVQVAELVP